jgi:hypothetical protein
MYVYNRTAQNFRELQPIGHGREVYRSFNASDACTGAGLGKDPRVGDVRREIWEQQLTSTPTHW